MPEQSSRRGDAVTPSRFTGLLIDPEDADLLAYSWYLNKRNGYLMRYVSYERRADGRIRTHQITLHTEILLRQGVKPPGKIGDHENRNKLDNRRRNLRWLTPTESNWNRRPTKANLTGYIGVKRSATGGKYFAQISVQNHPWYLGTFSTAEEAAHAYDRALLLLGGVEARFNFPLEAHHA